MTPGEAVASRTAGAAIAASVVLVLSASVGAQRYRSGVSIAVLDVSVLDSADRPVTGLQAEDFEILDNSAPAEVSSATFISVPASAPAVESDVWSNQRPTDRRVFAVVVDDLDIAPATVGRARDTLQRLIAAIPDGDLVSLTFSGQQGFTQDFTANRAALLEAVGGLTGRRPDADEADAIIEEHHNSDRVMSTLGSVVQALARADEHRSALLFVTGGLDSGVSEELLAHRRTSRGVQEMIAAAARAHVGIYPIDIRGLEAPGETERSVAALRALAAGTGGVSTTNTNDLQRAVRAAVRDLTGYYLVGYRVPDAVHGDADVRRVKVSVRRKGAIVRSRELFTAGDERRSAASGALDRGLSGGSIAIAAQTVVLAEPGLNRGQVLALVEIDGKNLGLEKRATDRFRSTLRVEMVAIDRRGNAAARSGQTLDLKVADARMNQIVTHGTRVMTSLSVKPGRYRIRLAVSDTSTGRFGTVVGDVDVPDFRRVDPFLTGVFVSSRSAASTPSVRAHVQEFASRLSGPPTAIRVFPLGEPLELYAELYAREVTPVAATMTVLDESGGVVGTRALGVAGRESGLAGATCYAIRAQQPFEPAKTGSYVFRLSITQGASSVSRDVHMTFK